MIGRMITKTIDLATLPTRLVVNGSMKALENANLMPGGLAQFQADVQQLLKHLDADFDRKVEDMTEYEREMAAAQEIGKAEHHLSAALISMLRLVRLATAEESRIIEHRD